MEADELLRNPFWNALCTEQAALSIGDGLARRYPADCIPFAGLASWSIEGFEELHQLLAPGESIFVTQEVTREEPVLAPEGLAFADELPCLQMVYSHPQSDLGADLEESPPVELLGAADVPEMIALKAIAFPGYYGPRAPYLGTYYGIRVGGELVAMAGERTALPGMREVSAVCTHPSFIGRGYAARLMRRVMRDELRAGLTPILHVIASNQRAVSLYERLGFIATRTLIFHRLERGA